MGNAVIRRLGIRAYTQKRNNESLASKYGFLLCIKYHWYECNSTKF